MNALSQQMGRMQYQALARQQRMNEYMAACTGSSCSTFGSSMATGMAVHYQEHVWQERIAARQSAQNALQDATAKPRVQYCPDDASYLVRNADGSQTKYSANDPAANTILEFERQYQAMRSQQLAAMQSNFFNVGASVHATSKSLEGDHAGAAASGCSGKPAEEAKPTSKERAETLGERIAARKERLSLKNSPLFGYMRWRFISPIHDLRMWLFRWLYRSNRGMT